MISEKDICVSTWDEEENMYVTSCGNMYFKIEDFNDSYKFCPYCGKHSKSVGEPAPYKQRVW